MTATSDALARTPLHEVHVEAGARIVPFAGFEMPVQYAGLVQEHENVRTAVGLFDVSHMGEVEFKGPRALETANRIVTNDLAKLADSQACYTAMCTPDGGIIDDLVAYRLSPEHVMICVNAANRAKDFAWMQEHAGGDCDVIDSSDRFAQIAVQGPKARQLVARLADVDTSAVANYWFTKGDVAGKNAIISRTGYTGEDGFELYVGAEDAPVVWRALADRGADLGVAPAGLGARDTLRLEMRYALYGNDIDETTNPYESGLGWVVKLAKDDFVGKAALERIKAEGVSRKLVGFEMTGRGIARPGYPILVGGERAGKVTSGTKSPSTAKAIAMGYVPVAHSKIGCEFDVEIRNQPATAIVVKTPFYRRPE